MLSGDIVDLDVADESRVLAPIHEVEEEALEDDDEHEDDCQVEEEKPIEAKKLNDPEAFFEKAASPIE